MAAGLLVLRGQVEAVLEDLEAHPAVDSPEEEEALAEAAAAEVGNSKSRKARIKYNRLLALLILNLSLACFSQGFTVTQRYSNITNHSDETRQSHF